MIKHYLVLCFILCLHLTGCTQAVSPDMEATIAPIQTSPSPALTVAPSIALALTPGLTQDQQVNTACPALLSTIPPTMKVDGQFVLQPLNSDKNPYLLNFTTEEKTYLPYIEGYYPEQFTVSPNYQHIAFFTKRRDDTTDNFLLIVTDLKGNIVYQEAMSKRQKWFQIDTWTNNQTLMLERSQYLTFPDGSTVLKTPLPAALLNPFTKESRDLNPSLPNLLPFFDPLNRWAIYGKSGTAYDPTITVVAYGGMDRDGRESIVLWDLNEERELASLQAPSMTTPGPIWSPDGSQFVTVSWTKPPALPPSIPTGKEWLSQELFSVSRAGKIDRLTYFTDQFEEVTIGGYVWSPDGSRVAFIVSTKPDVDPSNPMSNRLAILNIRTKRITMFCIGMADWNFGLFRLFWSPTGQQILAGVKNAEKSKTTNSIAFDTVLMDLAQDVIIKITDDTLPAGWMIAP